jgi:hypothetical protein
MSITYRYRTHFTFFAHPVLYGWIRKVLTGRIQFKNRSIQDPQHVWSLRQTFQMSSYVQ